MKLKIEEVSFEYARNGQKHPVLKDVGFSAREGELLCLVGRSGCGKTTLLKMIAGFIKPVGGKIFCDDAPVRKPGPDRLLIFQEDALFPWLTVEENVGFGLRIRRMDTDSRQKQVARFIDMVGLTGFADRLPAELSGGQRQRAALAQTMIMHPSVLLMDEPFGALDARTREEMRRLLLRLWKELGQTIVFVTHDIDEALLLADRMLVIDQTRQCLARDIPLESPRPRTLTDEAVIRIKDAVSDVLHA
jgi:NitT/TauT family transport system ATP-binding protein